MIEFDTIYLSWRKGQGNRRIIVGKLMKLPTGKYEFAYDTENVNAAKKEGFSPYTEFSDINKVYNGTVLDIFAQRLMKSERPDIQSFYNFWDIEPQFQQDKFYILGHTQGFLPIDNFEFLADYHLVNGLHFVTEVAGSSHNSSISGTAVSQGDELRFELELDNNFDKEAVKIFKKDLFLGYVKKVHCRVFHKSGAENLKLSVKAIDKNGVIRKIFIKVTF